MQDMFFGARANPSRNRPRCGGRAEWVSPRGQKSKEQDGNGEKRRISRGTSIYSVPRECHGPRCGREQRQAASTL
eukprot:276930-Pyramimonas_sp.AAC.1